MRSLTKNGFLLRNGSSAGRQFRGSELAFCSVVFCVVLRIGGVSVVRGGGDGRDFSCFIKIETRVDAEGGAIVQKTAARTFGFGQNLLRLLQRQRRESDGQ